MEFSTILKQARANAKKTLEEVAKDCDVSKATVQRWESGEIKNIRRDKIAKLSKSLNVSPMYLMGWTDELLSIVGPSKQSIEMGMKITNENNYFNKLIHLMEENNDSLDIISMLCKSIRIENKLLEETVARKANMNLEEYLLFEEDGRTATPSNIISILDALVLDYGFVVGYVTFALKSNLFKLIKDPLTRSIVERITALDEDQLRLLKTRLENLIKE